MIDDTPARRIILSRPALVYRADPTHSHGFTIVEVPKGDYGVEVRAVGHSLWVCLVGVPGLESETVGLRREYWEKMKVARLVGFGEAGHEPSPVESVADSPPAAAGRPEGHAATPGPAADGLSMELMRLSLDNIRAKARQAEAEAYEALDALDEPFRGSPLAVSGVVVPEAEGEPEREPKSLGEAIARAVGQGLRDESSIDTARNVAAFPAHEVNGYVGRLRAEVDKANAGWYEAFQLAVSWQCKADTASRLEGQRDAALAEVDRLKAENERLTAQQSTAKPSAPCAGMPSKIVVHNACSEPCDALVGPCCCGAWHDAEDWAWRYMRSMEGRGSSKTAGLVAAIEDLTERNGRLQAEVERLTASPSIPALQRAFSAEVRADVGRDAAGAFEARAKQHGERLGEVMP